YATRCLAPGVRSSQRQMASRAAQKTPQTQSPSTISAPRPVMLATLSVRVDAAAESMAMESALEAGVRLIVADMMMLRPYPLTVMLAPEAANLPQEEDLYALRATASRAVAMGIETELLRVSSPRPVRAMIELAGERQVGLLVFGPDRARLP